MQIKSNIHFFEKEIFELLPIAFGNRFTETPLKRVPECCSDFYAIHYIAEGTISLTLEGKSRELCAGDAFLTKPGEVFQFFNDSCVHYIWIKFRGKTAEVLDSLSSFHRPDSAPFFNMITRAPEQGAYEEYIVGELYRIISGLSKSEHQHRDYIRKIKSFIHDHPTGNVSVEEIARLVNLNRQYLSTLFHREAKISLRDYILKMRARRARLMLQCGHTVGECAELTGYASIYAFSKAFKKATGKSPTHFFRVASPKKRTPSLPEAETEAITTEQKSNQYNKKKENRYE